MSFTGRRLAVVSGGCSGIGLAIVRRLLQDGYCVAVADLQPSAALADTVESASALLPVAPCDVADPASVAAFFSTVGALHPRVSVLVHSAGIYPYAGFRDVTYELWRRVLAVNLDGFFLLAQGALASMLAAGEGRIIGIASNTFFDGTAGMVPYVASKGGMIGMVRSLASELGDSGITVNAVAPSITRTPTTEAAMDQQAFSGYVARQAIKRLAVPEDYVGTVSFLASPDAAFMTGQTLIVDGGWTHN